MVYTLVRGVVKVERLQVQLTESQVRALKLLALKKGVSVAEMIRRGVDRQLTAESSSLRKHHLERLKKRVDQLSASVPDLAANHDAYLAEAFDDNGDIR